jgi:hypothetical protein
MLLGLVLALIVLVFIASPVEAEIPCWPQLAPGVLTVSFDGHSFTIG